jgi:hypothetical protein
VDPDKEKASSAYAEMMFVLVKALKNDPIRTASPVILDFQWIASEGGKKIYSSTCWKFELIMALHAWAVALFNASLKCATDKQKERDYLLKAYSIVRHGCMEEVQNWATRREMDLPYECTLRGCEDFGAMCVIKLQRLTIVGQDKWTSKSLPIRMSKWLFDECHRLHKRLVCRYKDGSVPHLEAWAKYISLGYKVEAACLAFLFCSERLSAIENGDISLPENEPWAGSGSPGAAFLLQKANDAVTSWVQATRQKDLPEIKKRIDAVSEKVKDAMITYSARYVAQLALVDTMEKIRLASREDPMFVWKLFPLGDPVFFSTITREQSKMSRLPITKERALEIWKELMSLQ